MGKRSDKKTVKTPYGSHNSLTLREESSGQKLNVNVKSKLKHQHLQSLAVWSASGDNDRGSIPSYAAFFGRNLAAVGETSGIQLYPALITCQRCETVLQPGSNCTVRIEKNQRKTYGKRTHKISVQNNVVYTCHFCSHKNLRRGTPKSHMKEICPPKVRPSSKFLPANATLRKQKDKGKDEVFKVDDMPSVGVDTILPTTEGSKTPQLKAGLTLLDAKSRKRNRSRVNKPAEPQSVSTEFDTLKAVGASSKKRRKSWTSLKEIAESREQDRNRNISNIKIPFFLNP